MNDSKLHMFTVLQPGEAACTPSPLTVTPQQPNNGSLPDMLPLITYGILTKLVSTDDQYQESKRLVSNGTTHGLITQKLGLLLIYLLGV